MIGTKALAGCLMLGSLALPGSAFAMGGGIGCPDLPEYYRALGTIENGPGSCDMTLEEAQRIIAREQGRTAPAATAPRPHRHHHHRRSPQPN